MRDNSVTEVPGPCGLQSQWTISDLSLSGHSSEDNESHRFVVMEILASPEGPDQDQEQGDSKEKAARTVDRKLLDILYLHPPKQRLS
jgi:hypothetical protein